LTALVGDGFHTNDNVVVSAAQFTGCHMQAHKEAVSHSERRVDGPSARFTAVHREEAREPATDDGNVERVFIGGSVQICAGFEHITS
jgi:hypothetical protein